MLYDLTTLHFETDVEDRLRKVGMSKERRVDPQVTVGLLTTGTGFPLEVHLFEGNKAETKTLVPVLTGFAERHHIDDVVVVADAGMLSAANLLALEEAGFAFIVGSKPSSAADDLADHFRRHGNAFTDGQTIEATRTMGTGKDARERRVVYEYSFKRSQHDNRAINKMIERAEAVAAGTRPLKKDRFVKITDAVKGVDWDLVERARYLAGLKGYVTNIDPDTMDGPARRGGLPRALPGRAVLPDGQVRPRRTADVPPDPRQHRGPPDHRVRRTRGLPRGTSPHRRQHQEDRPDATAAADRHHQPRHPADHRPTTHPRPRPSHPRRPRRGWSLNRYNSGLTHDELLSRRMPPHVDYPTRRSSPLSRRGKPRRWHTWQPTIWVLRRRRSGLSAPLRPPVTLRRHGSGNESRSEKTPRGGSRTGPR